MRKLLFVCLLALGTVFTTEVVAQNPKQTKKHQKSKKPKPNENLKGSYRGVAADSDGDGVQDYTDKCPHTPKGMQVTPFGCPLDTDFDGVYDYEDQCINEKGPADNHGCPWGDKDGDGINDKDDKCPGFAGLPQFDGCPDTDKDGIPDSEDNCPTVPGLKSNKGCPAADADTDGDGLKDSEDLCPTKVGPRSNKGCPELKAEDKQKLQKAFDNLLFETGKDVIVSSSFPSLNDLGVVLANNPEYKLHLEGHTDNKGDATKNLDLSKRRAESVKKYLVNNSGIDPVRITSNGFGDTKPKASNADEAGRKLNRRVEMSIGME